MGALWCSGWQSPPFPLHFRGKTPFFSQPRPAGWRGGSLQPHPRLSLANLSLSASLGLCQLPASGAEICLLNPTGKLNSGREMAIR